MQTWLLTDGKITITNKIFNSLTIPHMTTESIVLEDVFWKEETKDEWFEKNYDTIRSWFEEELIDQWYSRQTVSEVNDWRDEYVNECRKDR